MSMDNNITAKEAREQLLEIWTNCKFGVKELVKKEYSHRAIHYMLSTEAYSDTNKILAVIETIKQQVVVVKHRVNEMDEKIKRINNKVWPTLLPYRPNTEKILQIIECIKTQVDLVKTEVIKMQNKIDKV